MGLLGPLLGFYRIFDMYAAATDDKPNTVHWAVRMNHRNRTWGFLLLGLLCGLTLAQQTAGWATWGLLGGTYLVYPQLAWLVARRASVPLQQELRFMQFDAFLCGAWSAALHFPLWIAFTLLISVLMNLTLFRGFRGLVQSSAAWVLGALMAGSAVGWNFMPDTPAVVTWSAMAAISAFLLITALDNYRRSMRLHQTRQKLKAQEQHLHHQLDEISALQEQLQTQALRDALTGLYNRHHLHTILTREIERSRRSGQPLSMVLIDVDHFKAINDQWGHLVGDEVLRGIALLLKAQTRLGDWCFRFGGEEFLILLPDTDARSARQKSEMLLESIRAAPIACTGNTDISITASMGLATYPSTCTDADSLISNADKALYQAKRLGRNRIQDRQRH